MDMDISFRIKDNGRPVAILHKNFNGTIGNMKVTDINMIISELKNKNHPEDRRFVISIRQDYKQQYKLTQFHYDLDELIGLRNQIDRIIFNKQTK